MFESKYSKVLTVILIIVIIGILGLLAFLGYDWYNKYFLENEASAFVENYTDSNNGTSDTNTSTDGDASNPLDKIDRTNTVSSSTSAKEKPTYKGFYVDGTIEIPATDVSYPIIEKVSKSSLETSVAFLYGAGINQVGNSVIVGHNYRNGLFFSNNKKLNIGDTIYVTDNSKNRLTYKIYDKFETTPEDVSFYSRDTAGVPEITLSTCNDDSSKRLIILARAE